MSLANRLTPTQQPLLPQLWAVVIHVKRPTLFCSRKTLRGFICYHTGDQYSKKCETTIRYSYKYTYDQSYICIHTQSERDASWLRQRCSCYCYCFYVYWSGCVPVMRAFQSIMCFSSTLRKTEEETLRGRSAAMPASSLPTRACLLRGATPSPAALSLCMCPPATLSAKSTCQQHTPVCGQACTLVTELLRPNPGMSRCWMLDIHKNLPHCLL